VDIDVESWQTKIRNLAPAIENAEYNLMKAEADIKRLQATLETKAVALGCKTIAEQKRNAEAAQSLYDARLHYGVCKGALSSLKVQLKALEVGFEEWRTKMVNRREEQKRYGA
jgi:chromosome segregation ATPase